MERNGPSNCTTIESAKDERAERLLKLFAYERLCFSSFICRIKLPQGLKNKIQWRRSTRLNYIRYRWRPLRVETCHPFGTCSSTKTQILIPVHRRESCFRCRITDARLRNTESYRETRVRRTRRNARFNVYSGVRDRALHFPPISTWCKLHGDEIKRSEKERAVKSTFAFVNRASSVSSGSIA